jgi:multidrug efflux system membrane fusion protein
MVGVASTKTIPVQLSAIGKVFAYATVMIKAQVSGELLSVHFREGQEVKKGDLLFTIDSRPFEAQLREAEAKLARDRAQLQNARRQSERYGAVVSKGFVSEEVHDQVVTNAAALEAAARAAEAAVEKARLELKYCTIRSPLDGVTGELKVDQGNLIKANDTDNPMVTIRQVYPIYVSFSVPEMNLPEVRRHMAERKLEVLAVIPGGEEYPVSGQLDFVDNTVDPATGTIQLKASFENRDKTLWPGQFVNVVLTLSTESGVVVPAQAVQTGQQGHYVFVVKPDLTVEYRPVTLGRTVDGESLIRQGVAADEKVVTDGQLRLAQGALIRVVEPGGGEQFQ